MSERQHADPATAEAVITAAEVAPGHDGQAELLLRVRYDNGAVGSVILDADAARRLMENCGARSAADLRGQPWQRLLDVVRPG